MLTRVLLSIAATTLLFSACSDDETSGPTVSWASNPTFETVEIAPVMGDKATVVIKAEAGIKDFNVVINSPILNSDELGKFGLTTDLDLIGNATVVTTLGGFRLPVGDALKDKTEVSFNIGGLLSMILLLPTNTTAAHTFTLNITDKNGESISKDLKFNYVTPAE